MTKVQILTEEGRLIAYGRKVDNHDLISVNDYNLPFEALEVLGLRYEYIPGESYARSVSGIMKENEELKQKLAKIQQYLEDLAKDLK